MYSLSVTVNLEWTFLTCKPKEFYLLHIFEIYCFITNQVSLIEAVIVSHLNVTS